MSIKYASAMRIDMPRLSGRLVRLAAAQSPLLVPLLNATKSLPQAQAELRWIQNELPREKWSDAIARRSRLEPLQYILGTQPFGPLEILCEKNVLIPRWETEEWTSQLGEILKESAPDSVSILDACTGTGCIPLLLKTMLPSASVSAFDKSTHAVALALKNKRQSGLDVDISHGDLFSFTSKKSISLVTSNPPYIPLKDYEKPSKLNGPEKSVRLYEPREALVGHLEFYEALVNQIVLPQNAEALVFELGYQDQVLETARNLPAGWACGRFIDSAHNLRCVVAWKGSRFAGLQKMVNGGFVTIPDT